MSKQFTAFEYVGVKTLPKSLNIYGCCEEEKYKKKKRESFYVFNDIEKCENS